MAYNRRDLHHATLLGGAVVNAVLSKGLKRMFRQQRPSASCAILGICDEFGLPSSHSQILSFSLVLVLCFNFRAAQVRTMHFNHAILTLEAIGMFVLSALTGYARVYLGYHSVFQVLLGFAVGGMLALVQYLVTARYLHALGKGLVQTRLARILSVENDFWPEYFPKPVKDK